MSGPPTQILRSAATVVAVFLLLAGCRDEHRAPERPAPEPPTPAPAERKVDATPGPEPDAGLGPGSEAQQDALRVGNERLEAGDVPGALSAFRVALEGEVSGASVSAGIAAADLHESRKEMAAARAMYEALLKLAPELPEVQFTAARFFAGQREPARAIEGFSKTIELQPDFLPAYPPLGALLVQAGRNEEAGRRMVTYESRLGAQLRVVRDERTSTRARVDVIHLLATLDDERVEKALIGLLEAPNRQMRIAAASAIADAPSPKGLAALRVAAEVEVEPFSRRVLSEALKRADRNAPPK